MLCTQVVRHCVSISELLSNVFLLATADYFRQMAGCSIWHNFNHPAKDDVQACHAAQGDT